MKKETIKIELNKKQRLAILKALINSSYRYKCLREVVEQLGDCVRRENPSAFSGIMNTAIIKNHCRDYIVEDEDNSDE